MSKRVAKLPRAPILACITCPLCKQLFEEATTISCCLHTFCKNCIYEKFSDEECDTCPVCNIYLGSTPEDKLRPDINMQNLREKIFPRKSTDKAAETTQSGPPPSRSDKNSLSSLVVSTLNLIECSSKIEKRSKSDSDKTFPSRGPSPPFEGPLKIEKDKMECDVKALSSPASINKIVPRKKLVFSSSKNRSLKEEDDGESVHNEKDELWQPLRCLVDAANQHNISNYDNQGKSTPYFAANADLDVIRTDSSNGGSTFKGKKESVEFVGGAKKSKGMTPKTNKAKNSSDSLQLLVDVVRFEREKMPIWFSLVPSDVEDEATRLPQLSSRFLRVKNGMMPVSYLQMYIARKFELAKEDEVEIKLEGEALLPSLLLRDVLDKWTASVPASRLVKAKVGDSMEEYVMPLNYARKPLARSKSG